MLSLRPPTVRHAPPTVRAPSAHLRLLLARASPAADAADPAAAHPAAWDACLAALAPLDLAPTDAEDALSIAFGWARSTYWRGSKDKATPDPGAVAAALAVLTGPDAEAGELGMSNTDAAAIVEAFPECLALDGDGAAARTVVKKLAKDWKMVGASAARAVGRTPRVLGYTEDCLGDCIGLCDRCWVRF